MNYHAVLGVVFMRAALLPACGCVQCLLLVAGACCLNAMVVLLSHTLPRRLPAPALLWYMQTARVCNKHTRILYVYVRL